jgi:quercetin dioxygenase-like cupin family protein
LLAKHKSFLAHVLPSSVSAANLSPNKSVAFFANARTDSDEHADDAEALLVVLRGTKRISLGPGTIDEKTATVLTTGQSIHIPRGVPHRVWSDPNTIGWNIKLTG